MLMSTDISLSCHPGHKGEGAEGQSRASFPRQLRWFKFKHSAGVCTDCHSKHVNAQSKSGGGGCANGRLLECGNV